MYFTAHADRALMELVGKRQTVLDVFDNKPGVVVVRTAAYETSEDQ